MDKICLNRIPCSVIVGTLPGERTRRQVVVFDLALELDLSAAAASDALSDTVDYSEIERKTVELAEQSGFLLLEALAGAVGRMVLEYPPVRRVRVRVEKPRAARFGRSVSVELECAR